MPRKKRWPESPPEPSRSLTPEIEAQILDAAKRALPGRALATLYDLGQWWIAEAKTGFQWAVEDTAEPGQFRFLEV